MSKPRTKKFGNVRVERDILVPTQFLLTGCGRSKISESAIKRSIDRGGPHPGFKVMGVAPTPEAAAREVRDAEAKKKASKKKAPGKAVRGRKPKRGRGKKP